MRRFVALVALGCGAGTLWAILSGFFKEGWPMLEVQLTREPVPATVIAFMSFMGLWTVVTALEKVREE